MKSDADIPEQAMPKVTLDSMLRQIGNPILTIKELAAALRRSRSYVQWMKRRGFRMPGNRATVAEARLWLDQHQKPCQRRKK